MTTIKTWQQRCEEHPDGIVTNLTTRNFMQEEIDELRAKLEACEEDRCEWTRDDEDSSTWSSSCGELWSFIDGGPAENRVTYCHHCGKLVDKEAS